MSAPARQPAVGVCGYGRCGSTMAMQMLVAGGLPAVKFSTEPPHELEDVRMAWQLPLESHCVKLLDSALYYGIPPATAWRFLWLDRDPLEQARSHVKFVTQAMGVKLDEPEYADEPGTSLRAAGWRPSAELRARPGWDTPSRPRMVTGTEGVARIRWEIGQRSGVASAA